MKRLKLGNLDISSMMYLNGEFVYVPFGIPFELEYLMIGGGGAAGYATSGATGGGGAGYLITGSVEVQNGTSYNIIVGAGGGISGDSPSAGQKGEDSTAFSISAYGGMGGAAALSGTGRGTGAGGINYGSRGGQARDAGGFGDNDFGNVFGQDAGEVTSANGGSGGGGTLSPGGDWNGSTNFGVGGNPTAINYDGQGIVYFGAGGSGAASSDTPNPANWGGPGSGGGGDKSGVNGKAGLVWLRYNSPFLLAVGGDDVYRIGDYMYHKFTTTGTSTFRTL